MLRNLQDYRMLIYSIVLIVVMIFTSAPAVKQYIEVLQNKFPILKGEFGFAKSKKPIKEDR